MSLVLVSSGLSGGEGLTVAMGQIIKAGFPLQYLILYELVPTLYWGVSLWFLYYKLLNCFFKTGFWHVGFCLF